MNIRLINQYSPSFKQLACSSLLLFAAAGNQVSATEIETHTVLQYDDTTVAITKDELGVRMSSSHGDLFSVRVQGRDNLLVNLNGVRQIYTKAERGNIDSKLSAEYQTEYRQLWESEAGHILGIPEDPEALFGVSFWEAVGCGLAAGAAGAATAAAGGWGAGVVGTACIAYTSDHSFELD